MSVENEAAGAAAVGGASLMSLLPMVIIFAIFYFLLIRPQVKRQRKVEQMIKEIEKGDKVIAAGGLYGTVVKVEDEVVYVEIAENTKIKALKASITQVLNKETAAEVKKEEAPKAKPTAKPAAKPTAKVKPVAKAAAKPAAKKPAAKAKPAKKKA